MIAALSSLAFLSPFWLGALVGLPVLWWLLRITPPAPRQTRFPAIRLLLQLKPKEETPAQTPLWLLILRMVLAALIIASLAHPLLNPRANLPGGGPVVLVVDDGWASGRTWTRRQETLAGLIDQAEREGRPVMMLTTAPSMTNEPPRPTRLMRAGELRTLAAALEPKSWPVDRGAAMSGLDGIDHEGRAAVFYLSDGIADPGFAGLVERLQRLGGVEVLLDAPDQLARMVMPPVSEAAALAITAQRADASGPAMQAALRAMTDDGRVLAREAILWQEGQKSTQARIVLPTELRNRVTRIDIEGESDAAAVVLLDERWRRRPVGLVSGGSSERLQPLLADTYYLERALTPFADVRSGDLADLLGRELAIIVLADVGGIGDNERNQLDQWIRRGGMVVRFAGPRMAERPDDLVPVPIRAGGGRAFGGAMSWAQPVGLAPFEPTGAFAQLAVPDDVRIERQVLAEPSLDLGDKTWARLSDGTPLVTADRRGDGWLVLIHTTANPEWSSLPLSGLFVEMMQRLVALSQGVASDAADAVLAPVSNLDGFGRLATPPPAAVAIEAGRFLRTPITARHPPGYYGSETARRALNLSQSVPPPEAIRALPPGVTRGTYAGAATVDLKPWLLLAALLLALIDVVISLVLRGLVARPWLRRAAGITLGLALAGTTLPASAQFTRTPAPAAPLFTGPDAAVMNGSLLLRFGYVRSGNNEADETMRAGLAGLANVLQRRTAVDPAPAIAIDIEQDEIGFFPIVFWPVLAETRAPSREAMTRLSQYLKNGGLVVFDTREGGGVGAGGAASARLRDILRQLNLAPLAPVPQGHVLTRAFYLLNEFPGRWNGQPVWVEQADERVNDGVSSVIIGQHDWAAAWANDANGRPLFAAVPGGETQRETAIRFGVNLVMYALTGNYKADQVHVDSILERLRR